MNEKPNPYRKLIEYLVQHVEPEVIINFRLPEDMQEYALDILDRYKEGRASNDEREFLDVFAEFDLLIGLWTTEAMLAIAEREPQVP